MTIKNLVEDKLFENGICSLCIQPSPPPKDLSPEEEEGIIYELMIPDNPRGSVIKVLKENKTEIEKLLGTSNFFIKIRPFHYFFSYTLFNDYIYKNGLKSFLSFKTEELNEENSKLNYKLTITVIGKPFDKSSETVESYLVQKIKDFNNKEKYTHIKECLVGYKNDPFILAGEPDPSYKNLDIVPHFHDVEYRRS